jgi:hypothetical protein
MTLRPCQRSSTPTEASQGQRGRPIMIRPNRQIAVQQPKPCGNGAVPGCYRRSPRRATLSVRSCLDDPPAGARVHRRGSVGVPFVGDRNGLAVSIHPRGISGQLDYPCPVADATSESALSASGREHRHHEFGTSGASLGGGVVCAFAQLRARSECGHARSRGLPRSLSELAGRRRRVRARPLFRPRPSPSAASTWRC